MAGVSDPDDLVTVFSYSEPSEASRAAERLEAAGLRCVIRQEHKTFDPTFALRVPLQSVHLMVPASTAARAISTLQADSSEPVAPTEAFLAEFSDEELKDVIARPDEWSPDVVTAASSLLQERGISVSDQEKVELAQSRAAELRRPEHGDPVWMAVGFTLAIVGGLFGILIGLGYHQLQTREPDGTKRYVYDRATRQRGLTMVLIGVGVSLAVFVGALIGS